MKFRLGKKKSRSHRRESHRHRESEASQHQSAEREGQAHIGDGEPTKKKSLGKKISHIFKTLFTGKSSKRRHRPGAVSETNQPGQGTTNQLYDTEPEEAPAGPGVTNNALFEPGPESEITPAAGPSNALQSSVNETSAERTQKLNDNWSRVNNRYASITEEEKARRALRYVATYYSSVPVYENQTQIQQSLDTLARSQADAAPLQNRRSQLFWEIWDREARLRTEYDPMVREQIMTDRNNSVIEYDDLTNHINNTHLQSEMDNKRNIWERQQGNRENANVAARIRLALSSLSGNKLPKISGPIDLPRTDTQLRGDPIPDRNQLDRDDQELLGEVNRTRAQATKPLDVAKQLQREGYYKHMKTYEKEVLPERHEKLGQKAAFLQSLAHSRSRNDAASLIAGRRSVLQQLEKIYDVEKAMNMESGRAALRMLATMPDVSKEEFKSVMPGKESKMSYREFMLSYGAVNSEFDLDLLEGRRPLRIGDESL